MTIMNKYKYILIAIVWVLLCGISFYLGYHYGRPEVSHTPRIGIPKITANEQISLSSIPKTSATDNDLELTQVYKASINNKEVVLPKSDAKVSPHGDKVILEQTVDFTEVVTQMSRLEIDKQKRRVEGGIGLGVHDHSWYIPVSLQRNFNPMESLEVELHLDTKDLTHVNGWEVKYKRKLW